MCDQCQRQHEREDDDAVRWLALLIRRVGILLVTEVERKYELEPSLISKRERQRREREQRAA